MTGYSLMIIGMVFEGHLVQEAFVPLSNIRDGVVNLRQIGKVATFSTAENIRVIIWFLEGILGRVQRLFG